MLKPGGQSSAQQAMREPPHSMLRTMFLLIALIRQAAVCVKNSGSQHLQPATHIATRVLMRYRSQPTRHGYSRTGALMQPLTSCLFQPIHRQDAMFKQPEAVLQLGSCSRTMASKTCMSVRGSSWVGMSCTL